MENFSSVVHDITFHTVLVLTIFFDIDVRVIKVKVAFLFDSLTGDISYHLQKKNEIALHNLGYTGPIKQTIKSKVRYICVSSITMTIQTIMN